MRKMNTTRAKRNAYPWGTILGLLMAAFVTLACVVQGVEPVVILKRAVVSAMIVGFTIAGLTQLFYVAMKTRTEVSTRK